MSFEPTRSTRQAKAVYKTSSGELVPGVTTIIGQLNKPALVHWAFKVGKENPQLNSLRDYVDDLANIGKCAHAILSGYLRDVTPNLSDFTANDIDAAKIPVNKFLDWYSRHEVTLLAADKLMVSDRYRFGGTLDVFANIDGRRTVLDFKTGKAIYPEMFMQVGAYAELLREKGEVVDAVQILQIGRTGNEGFSESSKTSWKIQWLKFLALRQLYDLEKAEERGQEEWDVPAPEAA